MFIFERLLNILVTWAEDSQLFFCTRCLILLVTMHHFSETLTWINVLLSGGRRKKRKNRRKQKQICLTNDYHNATVSDKQCPSLPGLSSPIDGALSCHYKNLCLPDRTEYLVYRNLTVDNKTLILAFDNVKTQLVEIWTYAVHKGMHSFCRLHLRRFQILEVCFTCLWMWREAATKLFNLIVGYFVLFFR